MTGFTVLLMKSFIHNHKYVQLILFTNRHTSVSFVFTEMILIGLVLSRHTEMA